MKKFNILNWNKLLFAMILSFILLSSFAYAAHTFDTKAEKNQSTSPSTKAYTVGAGGTLLVLSIMTTTTGIGTNLSNPPTYNGVALTRAGTTLGDTGGEGTAEIFYMINPPTGASYNIIVYANATGLGDISYIASSYKAQSGYTSALDSTNKSSNSTGPANPNIWINTTTAGDVIVDALFDGLTSAPTANNQVLLYSRDTGSEDYATQYNLSSAAQGVKMNYTIAVDDTQYFVAAFKEVIVDTPVVNILNTSFGTTNTIPSIYFNYTNSLIPTANCSLYFNGISTANNATVLNNTATILTSSELSAGSYSVYVNCTVASIRIGTSDTITVNITLPPTYSLNLTSSNVAGTNIMHSLFWNSTSSLYGYIFSFDNGTGVMVNDSYVAFSGTFNWSNVSKSVNSTVGAVIEWCVYANDTNGLMNGSSCVTPFSYVTTDGSPPTYSLNSTNSTLAGTNIKHSLYWQDNYNLSSYIFSFNNGSGFVNDTRVLFSGTANWSNVSKSVNSTVGVTISWCIYTNDTSGNLNGTSCVTPFSYVTTDGSLPTYSLNSTNSTLAGTNIKHSLYWQDNYNLSSYIFSFDNCTGTFVNDSSVLFSGTGNWSNISKGVSNNICTIRWCVYANDTSGNMNGSNCANPFSYTTTDNLAPTYSLNLTNSTVAGTNIMHSLYWTDNINFSGYIFSFDNGTGTLINDSFVLFSGVSNWSNVTKSVNSTIGAIIRWCVYANDTSSNMNGSSCITPFSYITTGDMPPTYSLNLTNSTVMGTNIMHSLYWQDDVNLSSYIFSFDNCTGTFVNDSSVLFSGTGNWSNISKNVPNRICTIRWCVYANDTSGNLNRSSCDNPFSYVTREDISPTYSLNSNNYTSGATNVMHSLYWQDNTNLSSYIFSFDNCTGTFINDTSVSFTGTGNWSNVSKNIPNNICTVRWCVYANDSSGNINGSSCNNPFTYIIIDINSPIYSLNSTSRIVANTTIIHSLYWQDNTNLSSYVFSWSNGGNWSASNVSGDLESGYQSLQGTGTSTITRTASALPSANAALSTGWTNPTNMYGTGNTSGNATVASQNHTWYGFNTSWSIPVNNETSNTTINAINFTLNCSCSNNTGINTIVLSVSNNSGTSWSTTFYDTYDLSSTYVFKNTTYFTSLWGLSWSAETLNTLRVKLKANSTSTRRMVCDAIWAQVNYTLETKSTDLNNSPINYSSGITDTLYNPITLINVKVEITNYSNSTSKARGNTVPLILVNAYDGTNYAYMGNITPTATGNFSLNITNSTILSAWNTANNRNISLQIAYVDGNSTLDDILNYTDVWITINNTQEFLNDTPISFSGTGNWSNITKLVTPTIGATIQWCIYANDTSGNWNTSSCENPFIYITTGDMPPTYSLNSTNSTVAGTNIMHSLYWEDDVNLSGYIFSFDNGTGTLINDSFVLFSGVSNWSNVTKSVNSTIGAIIRWCVYANDTSSNMNGSSCITPFSYITTNVSTIISTKIIFNLGGIFKLKQNSNIHILQE